MSVVNKQNLFTVERLHTQNTMKQTKKNRSNIEGLFVQPKMNTSNLYAQICKGKPHHRLEMKKTHKMLTVQFSSFQ